MGKTRIEWCTHTINPVKGLCPVGCSYCYARRMYKRFHWDETLKYNADWIMELPHEPSRIFMGSTMELFYGTPQMNEWLNDIIRTVKSYPEHTFIFLTKQSQNLPKVWPDNCWVGVSVTNEFDVFRHANRLGVVNTKVKFFSFEPLLQWNGLDKLSEVLKDVAGISWLIIGQQTPVRKSTMPKVEWIREIVQAADNAGVAVFLKDNLMPVLVPSGMSENRFWADHRDRNGFEIPHIDLRQEFPHV